MATERRISGGQLTRVPATPAARGGTVMASDFDAFQARYEKAVEALKFYADHPAPPDVARAALSELGESDG